jgi:hypothetical protein
MTSERSGARQLGLLRCSLPRAMPCAEGAQRIALLVLLWCAKRTRFALFIADFLRSKNPNKQRIGSFKRFLLDWN